MLIRIESCRECPMCVSRIRHCGVEGSCADNEIIEGYPECDIPDWCPLREREAKP